MKVNNLKTNVECDGELIALIALIKDFKQESEEIINKLDKVKMKLDEINAIIKPGGKDNGRN